MCRWRPLVWSFGVCVLLADHASAQMLTEAEALTRMRMEHPQVRVMRFTVRQAEAEARERRQLSNPTMSYTREDAGLSVDTFFLVTQELPVRGRPGLLGEAADHAVTAAQANTDAELLAIDSLARVAFADLLLAQERLAALEGGLIDLGAVVDVLRAREAEGEGSRFDRLRAEREVTDIETDLEVAAIGRVGAQARLASFFAPGTDPAGLRASGRLMDGGAVAEVNSLLAEARALRPDYRALTLSAARWETERRAAERLRYPGASVSAGLKRSGPAAARDTGYAVTATVALPLFNRGDAQVARAEAARARVHAEQEALAARIDRDVRVAQAAASRYRDLVDRYQAGSVDRADELAAIATAAYEEGVFGILELIDAHRATLGAQLRLLELSAAARRAAIELDRAVGREVAP